MLTKTIKIMASFDWSLREALSSFLEFLDPVIHFQGQAYKLTFGHLMAEPVVCGENLNAQADFIIDRTTHWSEYYKFLAQQALNSMIPIINNPNTFFNYDKHIAYDIMARAIHPDDYFPKTVLLPPFHPYHPDQERQQLWEYEQELIIENTEFGFDPARRVTDWQAVNEKLQRARFYCEMAKRMRQQFYTGRNYLQETVARHFNNRFPLYLKKASGGGGADVYKIHSLEELYRRYDQTGAKGMVGILGGRSFHLQEAIEDYDIFIRCIALGPQVLPMKFLPERPFHEHYDPGKPDLPAAIQERIINYALFIDSYHRWTYNSFEAIVKNGRISPIDFANACPDTNFISLHVHFPWAICALLRWMAFCAVTQHDLRMDMQQYEYLQVLNDPEVAPQAKYEFCVRQSREYFAIERFQAFCQENFPTITEQMVQFYDRHFDSIIRHAIQLSEFPDAEKEHFYQHYKHLMATVFRPQAMAYLDTPRLALTPG